ncbi:MAG: M61 family metallopeptidase [Leptolyngbyaceae cyanobacterium bins.59]|nr:M61 family metallopeptidase [Leptolyngbyaceae cyanobacterium bins.59]
MKDEAEVKQPTLAEALSPKERTWGKESLVLLESQTPAPLLQYRVAMSDPASHLFQVTLQVQGWQAPLLDLKMPVWTPGSYLLREYSRHVQALTAQADRPLVARKVSKNHWQVETNGSSDLTVQYQVFANELSVRTNHLDATHGYFNGAALFFFIPGFEKIPVQVTIEPPYPHWQVTTSLPPVSGRKNTFQAEDFDVLVDNPFEIGSHEVYEFEVLGKPHQFAIWGQGNVNVPQVIADTQKIIEVEAALFGGVPYDRYLFLLHLSLQGNGGLEHKNACSLNYPRFGFRARDRYNRFMQLVAHEFFHLWNVKRIRPKALETFDYEAENYTPSLWFSEGTTSYYDLLIPLRAGIYDVRFFLTNLGKEITRLQTIPGRKVQPVTESSFDAWIKLYRQDANSNNSQISYYLKGELVSLLLDLLIRVRHRNRRSLDDVMLRMWQQFGRTETGFTPEQLWEVIETVAETDLSDFHQRYLLGTEELPFNSYLEPFGLILRDDGSDSERPPSLGMTVKTEQGREMIKFVEIGSPAQKAGVDAGDELLALNGFRVAADQLNDRLRDFAPGQAVTLTLFHQDELRTLTVTLATPAATAYQVVRVEQPTAAQEENFLGWLGASLANI